VAACGLLLGTPFAARADDPYTVTWQSLGKDYRDSMPIGNGDLGINLWTEANGDVVFLIGKNDAWSENSQLLKLGRVRVSLTPNPFASGEFEQSLHARDGVIELRGKQHARLLAWVDVNAPEGEHEQR